MGGERLQADTDAALISRSLREPSTFTAVFDRHVTSVHRYLQRSASSGVAEDLTSEVFETAFRIRQRYDPAYPDARPWLFGIAANVARHHQRAEHRRRLMLVRLTHRDVPSEHEEGLDALVDHDAGEAAIVRQALRKVDPKFREVLLLYAGPQLSYEEIARALNVPVGTVRSRLSRGRQQLRELLAASGQDLMSADHEEPRP